MRSMTVALRARIRTALRIAFFLRVDEDEVRASWREIGLASLLVALAPTLYGLTAAGADGRWAVHNLPAILVFFALAVLSSMAIAEALRRPALVPVLAFAVLLAWLAIDAVVLAAWAVAAGAGAPPGAWFGFAPFGWVAVAIGRFAWNLRATSAPRRLMAAPLSALLFAIPLLYLAPDRALWEHDWSRDAGLDDRWALASEEAFYRQPEVLAGELAAVVPHRPGVVDVYFVGMAGYGYQDVFMREVDAVAALMRERFDAGGRVVKLVNNPKTVLSSPIASTTSLRAALARIAAQMDVEEDVLVLFLTSHGSESHRFSLDLWPLRFNELEPAGLRAILDESGIRHRVVIVSACYSGGFVEPLTADDALVITAASPDRNSFGCSNEADWTYFGKAYFDEALRRTHSFAGAFHAAAPSIEARENAEGHVPSRPMIAMGGAIRGKLAQLEAQLAANRGRAVEEGGLARERRRADRIPGTAAIRP